MNLPRFLQRSVIVGMGIAMLLALLLSSWLFRAEENDIVQQQHQRMAVLQANAMLAAVADTDAAATRERIDAMQRRDPRIESVIIIAGVQMLASTRPQDAAPRALRRDEKALYDLSNLLRTARETNRGEEVVRKKTIQIDTLP
ncbi:MAG: hypothetical protein PHH36_06270, partial [Sideroxydans sp.]|nr:hypothetical protein [Sideroxydans sp.]